MKPEDNTYEPSLLEFIESLQSPLEICAGQPVIPASSFDDLVDGVLEYPEVIKNDIEINSFLEISAMRFSACGANNSERFGVLRRNPKSHWKYVIDFLTVK